VVTFLNIILAVLALLSLTLGVWQWLAAMRFPLHKKQKPTTSPDVTLLKPLKGCDETTHASLQCWLEQEYAGKIQILFGVADANDPVCKVVKLLLQEFPNADAQLVVCHEALGTNAKVSTLVHLERLAKYGLILSSDADVRVPVDFLSQTVTHLDDPGVGLVNCFYRLANPQTSAMHWENIAVNADFWSQVLQSTTLKAPDFALGAVMLTRRSALEEIGGYAALTNCLADDYQLGRRLAGKGHRIALGSVVVECWDKPMNWGDVWRHQMRWARTIRVCQPLPYFMSILANATLWPLLWLTFACLFTHSNSVVLIAAGCLLGRIIMAWHLQKRFTPDRDLVSPHWLVPVKDLLHFAVWFNSFMGNTIEWRGERMRLQSDGTLVASAKKVKIEMVGNEGFEPPTVSV
jgi:ceramide glucosyltransferase